MKNFALTTIDNPYNPLTHFDEWYKRDLELGHDTCAYLDKKSSTSLALTDTELDEELERAIDDIVATDPLEIYIKVSAKTKEQANLLDEILKSMAEEVNNQSKTMSNK